MDYICEKCGARLDPGEKCDCEKEKSEAAGTASLKGNGTTIQSIARKKKSVNTLRELRINALASPKDFVLTVKKIYPKFDKTLESKCEHGEEYGIELRQDAMDLLREEWGTEKKTENRKLKNRIACRLNDDEYEVFKAVLKDKTAQDYLRDLLMRVWYNTYDRNISEKLQKEYCDRHDVPLFAPRDGMCYGCYYNIYDRLSIGEAGTRHITSCPKCHKSFID